MIFGKIKGYNIVCFSKKKAEKGNFGTAIHSVIQEKELQEEIYTSCSGEDKNREFGNCRWNRIWNCSWYVVWHCTR